MAWYLEDEVTPSTEAIFNLVVGQGAQVPSLFKLEVLNAFRTAIRKKRIVAEQRDEALLALHDLSIECDGSGDDHAWVAIKILSDKHGLTPYDAAYLELAMRMGASLATLDVALAAAAQAEGVTVLQ